ncbi:MAG: hypothetical protein EZS28_015790 [Streblomastix strix]|uniref:Uncharacterized protein n=1 Tax=Streblomastix strix TaxID=222440 RepID=A0A5J4W163_9EUKA|nr:MAG: hypothetical protein EZS28_015790 [Streblomastix strix]
MSEYIDSLIAPVKNDGLNTFITTEVEPISHIPCSHLSEIEINLTTNEVDVTQIQDSFIHLTIDAELIINFNTLPVIDATIADGVFLFVGLKNSTDIIRGYSIKHRGMTVTNTLQTEGTMESFVTNLYKPKGEKFNRKHVHTLWRNAHLFDTSVCGRYISYAEIKEAYEAASNQDITIKVPIDISIPIDDILVFSGMSDYHNAVFGELRIVFNLNKEAFVFCQVNPIASSKTMAKRYDRQADFDAVHKKWSLSYEKYNHGFSQFGTQAKCISTLRPTGSGDGSAFPTILFTDTRVTMRYFTVTKCRTVISGYRASPQTLNEIASMSNKRPKAVFAQRVETHQFQQRATSTGLNISQNIPLRYVTDFMLLFPSSGEQLTCFKNPMLHMLALNVQSRNIPDKQIATIGAAFYQMQLNATGLDGLFEIDDEVEDALTIPRSDGTQKLEDHTDLTNFAMILQVERNNSSGITFDGLNTKGQNTSITLKANPIYQGAADVYCGTNPVPPILITVSDTYWLFSALNGGTAMYVVDQDFSA